MPEWGELRESGTVCRFPCGAAADCMVRGPYALCLFCSRVKFIFGGWGGARVARAAEDNAAVRRSVSGLRCGMLRPAQCNMPRHATEPSGEDWHLKWEVVIIDSNHFLF